MPPRLQRPTIRQVRGSDVAHEQRALTCGLRISPPLGWLPGPLIAKPAGFPSIGPLHSQLLRSTASDCQPASTRNPSLPSENQADRLGGHPHECPPRQLRLAGQSPRGRPEWTRTIDLFRVKVHLTHTRNNFHALPRTAKA